MTIDWAAKIIYVFKTDLTQVQVAPIEVYDLDLDVFRLALKNAEDNEDGIVYDTTHNHYPPVSVGGVVLARVVELINDYTVTFENAAYVVNLVGANTNLVDRLSPNNVSVRSANSAGLQVVTQGSGVTEQDKTDIALRVWINSLQGTITAAEMMRLMLAMLGGNILTYDTVKAFAEATKTRLTFVTDELGNRTLVSYDASE